MKLLIADDEQIIRDGIAFSIDWSELGIDVVDTATDGLEALSLSEANGYDIIITDVRMPGMDGLKLIQSIRERKGACEFVILSGYDDFTYATTAMRMNVQYYLLKPCDANEMMDAVLRIRKKIDADSDNEQMQKKIAGFVIDSIGDEKKPDYTGMDTMELTQQAVEYVDRQNQMSEYGEIVCQMLTITKQKIHDAHFSLQSLSNDYMFMNEAYLSKLFLKRTGMKFSRYLTRLRMEKAKQLLVHSTQKMYEIAQQIGMENNVQYFSSQFKKEYGVTPKEYRIQNQKPAKWKKIPE